jgi:ATP-binding cassette subfamily B protein
VFLFQDFEKYFLSIEDNIALGHNDGDKIEKDVEVAAKLAQAHDFIVRLSYGYKTRIGRYFKDSEQLSGGQWQKLALSRIFYRDANLVVLDEPTSSLDPNAEFEVFENLKKNLQDQMIIVVTHRLYNLKIADHIYLLKDGRINQEGDFESLVKQDGEFKKMYSRQKL